jgi:hypothetical protein
MKMNDVAILYQVQRDLWLYDKNEEARENAERLQKILDKMGRWERITDAEIQFIKRLQEG